MKRKYSVLILTGLLLLNGCVYESQEPLQQETQSISATTSPQETEVPVAEAETVIPETTLPVQVPKAEKLEAGVTFFRGREDVSWNLSDEKDVTRVDLSAGTSLKIESSSAFSGLYIRWEKIPESCILQTAEGKQHHSAAGFLHEYILLEEPAHMLELIPSEGASICGISLYTQGQPPAEVQQWKQPCEQADILVFPTHSDDDVLFFGALIAHYAIEEGAIVQTAFLTDHYYEPIRNHERLDGLWEMGVRHYPVLGTAKDYNAPSLNHAINYHREDDILGWQVEQLRRFRPLVVVGHDVNGEYGHQQHILNTMYLTMAVELAAAADQYPQSAEAYGIWNTPKLYLHLYGEDSPAMEVNAPLSGDPAGRTAFQVAVDAYCFHRSQHQYYFQVEQGREHPRTDCSWFGLCRSTVGPDTGWNVMEHTWGIRNS